MFREADTKGSLTNRIRKLQATFFGHVMRRDKLEHLETSGMIEYKRNWGKRREKNVGWINKVVQSRVSDRSPQSDEG